MTETALSATAVADRLGFPEGTDARRYVEELGVVALPEGGAGRSVQPVEEKEGSELLDALGVPLADAADVLRTLPSPERAPEWWWCVERAAWRLIETMGEPDSPRGTWPELEGNEHSVERRCHFVHVALAVVPHTLAYFARCGVPEEIAWASLADLRRHMEIHRRVYGTTGVEAAWWITLSLRGELVDLGRLQYNRFTRGAGDESPGLWYSPEDASRLGPGFCPGDPCLGIHIPEGAPLSPASVEESVEMAGRFFREHYTTDRRRIATCLSWMLDDQLAEYLPADSNIITFQRRFELVPDHYEGDRDVFWFVFRTAPESVELGTLPQRTTMERAAVAHLRSGRHWRLRAGWLDLP